MNDKTLTIADFEKETDRFDQAVLETPGIDYFCSSSAWLLAAHRNLHQRRRVFIHHLNHTWLLFAQVQHEQGFYYFEPLEASWCFSCPVIGPDYEENVETFLQFCILHKPEWRVLLLSGVTKNSPFYRSLLNRCTRYFDVRLGQPTKRCVARFETDGTSGYEKFLKSRSANLQRHLKKAQQKAQVTGILFELVRPDNDVLGGACYDEIIRLEELSWKGQKHLGLLEPAMANFYRALSVTLTKCQNARILFAKHNGKNIGYLLGGVVSKTFRALQFSYDETYASYAVGNLMQLEMIRLMCLEGCLTYDLGMEMPYKKRWGEYLHTSELLLIYNKESPQ